MILCTLRVYSQTIVYAMWVYLQYICVFVRNLGKYVLYLLTP